MSVKAPPRPVITARRSGPSQSTDGSSTVWVRWLLLLGGGVLSVLIAGIVVVFLVVAALFGGGGVSVKAPSSIPGMNPVLLQAMTNAAQQSTAVAPDCAGMRWSILAGIAQVESNLAAGRDIGPGGVVSPRIIGPALDGSGVGGNRTAVVDSDNGRYDDDVTYDRAVGAWQFIPTSWAVFGRDGNGDGVSDPHNVFDNALGAVVHLCGSDPRDLADPAQLRQALYDYNRSWTYVEKVTDHIHAFDALGVTAGGGAVAGATGSAATVITAARTYLGTPYSWGGGGTSGPSEGFGRGAGTVGFDCSGLTQYAFAQAGVALPRVSRDQAGVGTWIPRANGIEALIPGDLVFFAANPTTADGIYHVGIYLGGGQMIDAPRTGTVVREEAVWKDTYAGAARLF